ncbi:MULTISPECIES: hypothetical protein [unclassified Microbacterium]|uniref:hypothetical protein n=1 Tax=unclassified Microbacterium TaxID=2609290 RepID=UPI0016052DFE|nr:MULTISPECIES: hypothetical protein [unclassified Microbacterium]QNA92705.1 hypothetical protein G4G29_10535 [Microbacterium sp. Se63.02b]QYM62839.1 hypothetical protein K1X59_10570 [Microbacterium sp. Se5.02b]
MKTYEVTAERDGKFWFVRIPELEGVTQALTEEEIPVMARDYIAVTLGVPGDSFEIALNLWRSEPLPNGVDEIIEYLARKARGYNNRLKWNEQEKLKADLMNEPNRWLVVTPERLRARAENAGMRSEDAALISDYLRRRKQGRRLVPKASYREFKFGYVVDTLP